MESLDNNTCRPVLRPEGRDPYAAAFGPRKRKSAATLSAILISVLTGCNFSLDIDAQSSGGSRISQNPIHDMSMSADGSRVAIQYWNGSIEVRDVESERLVATYSQAKPPVDSVALSNDGSTLVIGCSNGDISVNRVGENTEPIRMGIPNSTAVSVAISSDSRFLATGGTHPDDAIVRIWDIQKREVVAEHKDLPGTILHVSFVEGDRGIAFACGDGSLYVRSIHGDWNREVHPENRFFLFGAAVSPDGSRFASCGENGTVNVYNMQTGQEVWSKKTERCLHTVAFSPDGRTVAFGDGEGHVEFRQAVSGRGQETLQIHHGAIKQIAFHPRNGKIYSAGFDGLWWATPVPAGDE